MRSPSSTPVVTALVQALGAGEQRLADPIACSQSVWPIEKVYNELGARGVGVQVRYKPSYGLSEYRPWIGPADFPEAERACDGLLSVPLFLGLTHGEQDFVVKSLEAVL